MPGLLSPEEGRVLGCLLEKEAATPEYYPLTLNALRNACNQTSSRSPVVAYDDDDVSGALASLRERGLIRIVYSQSNRAAKYRHVLDEALGLDAEERALVCLLLLRGPQTVGELRTRSERLASFDSLEAVERGLTRLGEREDPLVARLGRAPGQKEARHRQLLAEEAPGTQGPQDVSGARSGTPLPGEPAEGPGPAEGVRADGVRDEIAAIRQELAELRAELERLRRRIGAD